MLCEKCKGYLGGTKDIQREREETLTFIAQQYSATEICNLLGITYNEIAKVKQDYENDLSKQLRELFDSNLVDKYDNIPFKLNDCIEALDLPYKSSISYKRMLANGTMPVDHIIPVMDYINQDYRPKRFN